MRFEFLIMVSIRVWHCVVTYAGINIGEACAACIFKVNCEYWGSIFLRNVGSYLPNCIVSHPIRPWLCLVICFLFSVTDLQWDYLRLFMCMTMKLLKKWMAVCVGNDWENVSDLNPKYSDKFQLTSLVGEVFLHPTKQIVLLGWKILELNKIVSPLLTSQHLLIIISFSFLKKGCMK